MLKVSKVSFEEKFLVLHLDDGTRVRHAVRGFPPLQRASDDVRAAYVLEEGRVIWPNLHVLIDPLFSIWDLICESAIAQAKANKWVDLDPEIADVIALWRLEADGHNGGFLQYFCNWGDKRCREVLASLQTIGANETRRFLDRQRAVLEPHLERVDDYDELVRSLSDDEQDLILDQERPLWDEAAEEIPIRGVAHFIDKIDWRPKRTTAP